VSLDPTQLRPLGIGEVLDAGLKVYRARFGTMLKAVAVVTVPVQVLSIVIQLSLPDGSDNASDAWATIAGFLVIVVIGVMSSALASAACFKAVSDTYLGTSTDWAGSLRYGYKRLGSLIWLTLLNTVLLIVGFLLCIVPGVWLYGAWSVAVPALLLEDARGRRALGRSFALVRGRWWPVAGTLFLANLLTVAVGFGFGVLAVPVLLTGSDFASELASGVVTGAASVFTIPFVSAVVAVLYFDLRVRKEGFDLQLMAERIGEPMGPRPTTMPWTPMPGGGTWGPPPSAEQPPPGQFPSDAWNPEGRSPGGG
jgi:hypothetical protein